MKIAVVLIVRDWDALNEAYAFDYVFQSLIEAGLSEPYHVLVAEGFEQVPAEVVGRWREANILFEDCSAITASLLEEEPDFRGLPGDPEHRASLLRHLILERRFGGEPVLSVNADVVWRMDPYRLFGGWRGGGFLAPGAGGFVHAARPEWFEAYRIGLRSALTSGALSTDLRQGRFVVEPIARDRRLIRRLHAKGMIGDAWEACRTSPGLKDLALVSDPLHPKLALSCPPERLAFERTAEGDVFSGAKVAFWHMHSGFIGLCSFFHLAERLIQEQGGRLPFPKIEAGRDNLKAALLLQLRAMVITGQVEEPRLKALRPQMFRRGVYKSFFLGKFATRLFSDRYWWEPGVFT